MSTGADKFCKRYISDLMLFSWVLSFRRNLPAVTIEKAIHNFYKHVGGEAADYNIDSEKVKYYRMEADFDDMQKNCGKS